jgi:arylsulfatase A-like enzyme
MIDRSSRRSSRRARRAAIALTLVALAGLAGAIGCGKSTREPARTEPSSTAAPPPGANRTAAADAKPVVPPVQAAPRGPERAVYSLVDNRLSAHLTRGGGLLVPAGSAGFAKYVRFANVMKGGSKKAWELRRTQGDVKVARVTGKSATVFVPLTAAQAGRGTLRVRAFAPTATTVSLRVNEHKDIHGKLEEGWSTLELAIPPGQLLEGENALQLFMKASGVEVAWLQIGATTPTGDDGAAAFYDPARKALLLPGDGQMSWYVAVPEGARLTGDLSDGSCTVAVRATAADGATAEGKLVGTGSAVELGALAGKAVRLDLAVDPGAAGCPTAALTGAALAVSGAAPAARRAAPPRHVVFLIMDSLRADRVRSFNPKARPESPHFDKLAQEATLFTQHYVQGNESQVSHASMWTSNYLAKHKALAMSDKLPDKWLTIDEVAEKAGMFIAGVSGNGYIRPTRGFGSAWDKYANHIEQSLGLKGADIMDKGLSFITPKKDRPWFLYLGWIDTHVTWRAKQPWIERYDPGYKGRFQTDFGDDGPGGASKNLSDREKDHVRALYDSNVSYQDDLLGKLIEKLTAWGVWDQTMLIITADHGDEQWEDGRFGHGASVRDTVVHVPLIVRYPPLFPAAKIAAGTEGIDIVPTLADALGIEADPEWQGMSLVGLANGVGGYPLLSVASQYENGHAGRIGAWKLKLTGTQTPRLYHLAKDPGEHNDLWGKPGSHIGARLLLDPMWLLRGWNAEWKKAQWGNAAAVTSRFAADLGE